MACVQPSLCWVVRLFHPETLAFRAFVGLLALRLVLIITAWRDVDATATRAGDRVDQGSELHGGSLRLLVGARGLPLLLLLQVLHQVNVLRRSL